MTSESEVKEFALKHGIKHLAPYENSGFCYNSSNYSRRTRQHISKSQQEHIKKRRRQAS